MTMKTTAKQAKAAKRFVGNWQGHGYEKGETQKFWIDLLANVFGIGDIANFIFFEEQVKDRIQNKTITNFIDAYIPATHVMIEQKSSDKDLREPIRQSDGRMLTPYQQAKQYVAELPLSQHPKWIVTCNFNEFLVYDMENPTGEPQQIFLKDLEKECYRLQFLVNTRSEQVRREEEVSLKAGGLVGKLYDALIKQYLEPDADSLQSLNILCVRLVFCLYAEDAGLFETRTSFEDYVKSFPVENLRDGIIKLFKALDTPVEQRDKYDLKLKPFPYVNGGLFAVTEIEIPNFSQEIVDVLVNHCAPFNWSEISPTIFGAVFESTLNPETRRKGGMHYTSIENIHKVIDPLFMNELETEFQSIMEMRTTLTVQRQRLLEFQNKLGTLTFLDPACGSGNFLTETYISLRRLENKVIVVLNKGEKVLGFNEEFIKVNINQFYGIEINDFAVTVAKTALWIAECQMAEETERLIGCDIDFLPLKNHANIVEGNALRMDWKTLTEPPLRNLLFTEKLNIYQVDDFEDVTRAEESRIPYNDVYKELNVATKEYEFMKSEKEANRKPVVYNYIMGNPPFVGYAYQSKEQKSDLATVCPECGKNIDYVVGWYYKTAEIIKGEATKAAFVSTNSITQGEQVTAVWKNLIQEKNIRIDFAYRTFRWDSESEQKAHVHCVIVGFSDQNSLQKEKLLFDENGNKLVVANINPYLMNAQTVFIEKRRNPICDVSKINKGSQPTDGGNLIITDEEYNEFIKKEPGAQRFIRQFLGADEFINGKNRYCLWLVNATPSELRKMPFVMKRVEAVKQMRLSSPKESTRVWAAYPYLFTENRQPERGHYLLIPRVSSEKRKYVPIGYVPSEAVSSDAVQLVPNATFYEFGVLTSVVHNAWMRIVCGRLKSDYRYSNEIVYNNFPWPSVEAQDFASLQARIEQTAQDILDTRAKYPNSSLADLYDDTFMPVELRKAHEFNDKAVMKAYGFDPNLSENEIVAALFKMYKKLTDNQ